MPGTLKFRADRLNPIPKQRGELVPVIVADQSFPKIKQQNWSQVSMPC